MYYSIQKNGKRENISMGKRGKERKKNVVKLKSTTSCT